MKVYLARHGQTNYNELRLCNADPAVDVHLTEVGFKQAENLAKRLEKVAIERVYVSELQRTQQTAKIVNQYHDAPTTIDPRLNDIITGYEGKSADDYHALLERAPDMWKVRYNGGESLEDVYNRVLEFIGDLSKEPYTSVLVVTSIPIVQAFNGIVSQLSGEDAREVEVDKGSCMELEIHMSS